MDKELLRQCKEAAEADREKAMAIVAAIDKLYVEMWSNKPTTDR